MFDVDQFVADCKVALAESESQLAIKEVLERAVRNPEQVAAALPTTKAEIVPLYAAPDLSIFKVVWAPGMNIPAHDHLMWAAIGLYGGQEDNTLYRRQSDTIVRSGGKELRTKDAVLFGRETVHSIHNPLDTLTGAIHVYGGDLTTKEGRSEWDPETGAQSRMDFARTRAIFEEANARLAEDLA
jgi:predicted metal-dependent enzyme (double-stranded beta helix superfamily)